MASKRKKEHKTKKDHKARKEAEPKKEARKAKAAKPAGKPRAPQPAPPAKTAAKGKGGGPHEAPKGRGPADQAPKGEQRPQPSTSKRPARRSSGRRDGKGYAPGELLLPGGCQSSEEALYLLRGCVASEHPVAEEGLADVLARRGLPPHDSGAEETRKHVAVCVQRFASGAIEPMLPSRAQARRTFAGFVERARGRRREIGAFLRGLDIGRTEVSHLDSHGESSLQNLMEWMARIEKMVEEGEEPQHADHNQLHRGIDQLDATTEALIVDLELTLKRLRDRT
jgi:hypothetical protein